MFVSWKVVFGKPLSKLSCVCLPLGKLVNEKHFPVKGKFGLVSRKVFSSKIWAENTFQKLWKIYKCHIIYWLYQIWSSNFWLVCVYIYILFWIFIFQFHFLKFNFYINFGSHFYSCYLFFPYHFFIKFFYLSNLILIFLLLLILFEIIYEMLIIIILISSSFIFYFIF